MLCILEENETIIIFFFKEKKNPHKVLKDAVCNRKSGIHDTFEGSNWVTEREGVRVGI